MSELATEHRDEADPLMRRALNQAARELSLAAASDWGFLISTGQAVRYSELRILRHIDRAKELMRQVSAGQVEESYLSLLEDTDTIFPFSDMDFRVFCR
jgi:1,4-alpha-glucan branching enzyme